jgi:hypothetical protein
MRAICDVTVTTAKLLIPKKVTCCFSKGGTSYSILSVAYDVKKNASCEDNFRSSACVSACTLISWNPVQDFSTNPFRARKNFMKAGLLTVTHSLRVFFLGVGGWSSTFRMSFSASKLSESRLIKAIHYLRA